MKITKIICDVCREGECEFGGGTNLQIIFTTQQDDGAPIAPHLTREVLDICEPCMSRVLEGDALFGAGKKGVFRYWFKEKAKEEVSNHPSAYKGVFAAIDDEGIADE